MSVSILQYDRIGTLAVTCTFALPSTANVIPPTDTALRHILNWTMMLNSQR